MASTNLKIAIAVGITAAVGLAVVSATASPPKKDLLPPAPQLDVYGVIDKAAKYETDLSILRDLRDKVLAASQANTTWDPYWRKLQARLEALSPAERGASVVSAGGGGGGATATFRSMTGK